MGIAGKNVMGSTGIYDLAVNCQCHASGTALWATSVNAITICHPTFLRCASARASLSIRLLSL
jgi:hypothetical protein